MCDRGGHVPLFSLGSLRVRELNHAECPLKSCLSPRAQENYKKKKKNLTTESSLN